MNEKDGKKEPLYEWPFGDRELMVRSPYSKRDIHQIYDLEELRGIIEDQDELLKDIKTKIEGMKPHYEELVELRGRESAGFVLTQLDKILSLYSAKPKEKGED